LGRAGVELGENGSIIPRVEDNAMARRDAFRTGDRVELMLFCSPVGGPQPQGTVVSVGRMIHCKMDRNGKIIRFEPSDLRRIGRGETKAEVELAAAPLTKTKRR